MKAIGLVVAALLVVSQPVQADDDPCAGHTPSVEHAAKVEAFFQQSGPPNDIPIDSSPDKRLVTMHGLNTAAQKGLQALRCDEPALTAQRASVVEFETNMWSHVWSDFDKRVADEQACRTSDQCMAQRVCVVVDNRNETAQAIAKERANPGGVVDLKPLHDLGAQLQDDDAAIPVLKTNFARTRGKPFAPKYCQKT